MVGVASAPALGARWWTVRGARAFRDGERLAVSITETLAEATVNDDWWETPRHGIEDRPLSKIARRAARVRRPTGTATSLWLEVRAMWRPAPVEAPGTTLRSS